MSEQQHPQEQSDRQILEQITEGIPTPENLAEVARLLIRYQNFPGAQGVQEKLATIMQQWDLNKEALFAQTRKLYSDGQLGNQRLRGDETQDWS
jgi:hypothetical protein